MKPAPLTDEIIAQLKSEHGEIHQIAHPDDDTLFVVATVPSKADYARFKSEINSDRPALQANALEGLLKRNTVYPPRAEFEAMLEARPGLTDTFGNKLAEIAGVSAKATAKKL